MITAEKLRLTPDQARALRQQFASIIDFQAHLRASNDISRNLAALVPAEVHAPLLAELWRSECHVPSRRS